MELGDKGNTSNLISSKKRVIPCKKWVATFFKNELDQLEELFRKETSKGIIGSEICPTTGKQHFQCFFVFNDRVRANEKFKSLLGHWEKAKGDDESNYRYCSKEGKFVTWGHFDADYKITKDDLNEEQLAIAQLFEKDEDPKFGRTIHWYYEFVGGWGKSVLATYMVDNMDAIMVSGAKKDVLFGVSAMVSEGKYPRLIVVDIPRVNSNAVSIQALEMIKNGMFYNEKYESGMCRFPRPHIVCFANCEPDVSKMSKDRWIIRNLVPDVGPPLLIEEDDRDDL